MSARDLSQLTLHGGPKLRTDPWPARGLLGAEEKAAVVALFDEAMSSGQAFGYNGPQEEAYCQEFAAWMGGGYADGVSSGTAGLYVALRALDIEPFTEVIVGAVTDPGGMMPIPLLNCIPMVADVAPGSYNSGPEQIEPLLSPLTSAIVVAHIAGEPADMEGIMALAQEHGLFVIEDCSQSHGALLHGKKVGSFGDLGVFSTMHGKHHCTGGQGGVVYTRDDELAMAVRRASDRGKPFGLGPEATNVVASLNLNSNDLAATIGRVQLKRLPGILSRRRELVSRIREATEPLRAVSVPQPLPGAEPGYWFLRMEVDSSTITCDKTTFCQALAAEGLPIAIDYRAALPHTMDWFVHRRVFGSSGYPWVSPQYRGDPNRSFPCPNAQDVMDRQFNLYLHEGWGDHDVDDALAIMQKVENAYRA